MRLADRCMWNSGFVVWRSALYIGNASGSPQGRFEAPQRATRRNRSAVLMRTTPGVAEAALPVPAAIAQVVNRCKSRPGPDGLEGTQPCAWRTCSVPVPVYRCRIQDAHVPASLVQARHMLEPPLGRKTSQGRGGQALRKAAHAVAINCCFALGGWTTEIDPDNQASVWKTPVSYMARPETQPPPSESGWFGSLRLVRCGLTGTVGFRHGKGEGGKIRWGARPGGKVFAIGVGVCGPTKRLKRCHRRQR